MRDWVHFSSQRRSWAPLALGGTPALATARPPAPTSPAPHRCGCQGPPSSHCSTGSCDCDDLRLPAADSPESQTSESRLCPPLPTLWPRVPVLPAVAAAARLFPFLSTARGHFPLRLLSASRVSSPSSPSEPVGGIALRAHSWPISSCPSEMPHFWTGPAVPFGTRTHSGRLELEKRAKAADRLAAVGPGGAPPGNLFTRSPAPGKCKPGCGRSRHPAPSPWASLHSQPPILSPTHHGNPCKTCGLCSRWQNSPGLVGPQVMWGRQSPSDGKSASSPPNPTHQRWRFPSLDTACPLPRSLTPPAFVRMLRLSHSATNEISPALPKTGLTPERIHSLSHCCFCVFSSSCHMSVCCNLTAVLTTALDSSHRARPRRPLNPQATTPSPVSKHGAWCLMPGRGSINVS